MILLNIKRHQSKIMKMLGFFCRATHVNHVSQLFIQVLKLYDSEIF